MTVDSPWEQWLQTPDPRRLAAPELSAAAAEVVERLKSEADRHWAIDPNRSLELAGQIVAIGEARDDSRQIALGTMARGDALKFLGRHQEAWDALESAGALYQAANDEVGWARTRSGRVYLGGRLNRVADTLTEAEVARAILIAHNQFELRVKLDLNIGLLHNLLGDHSKARAYYEEGLATAQGLGAAGEPHLGALYTNLGVCYAEQGDLQRGLDHYERARALFAARNEPRSLTATELNLVTILQAQGRYRDALRLLHSAIERARHTLPLEAALARLSLVELQLGLNRYAEAQALARQNVAEYRTFRANWELGRALFNLTVAEAGLGHTPAAQAALDEARSLFASLGAGTWQAYGDLWAGRLALQQGQPTAAHALAVEAAARYEAASQQDYFAHALLLQAQAALAAGQLSDAEAAGAGVLAVARRNHVPSLRYAAHLVLGQAAEAANRPARAERRYRAAAATIDRVQRQLTLTLRPGFLADKGEALRRVIAQRLLAGQAQAAFEILECSKSQVLLGYLADQNQLRWRSGSAHTRALVSELNRLRAEHQWYYQRANAAQPDTEADDPTLRAQARAEVTDRERRMRAITEQLYLDSETAERAAQTQGVSMAALQQLLPTDAVMVEYYNDGQALWAFRLAQDGLTAHRLPLSVHALDRLVAQLQMNLQAALALGPAGARALRPLAQRLLRQLQAGLMAPLEVARFGGQRLVVVPFGALHYLPFQALFDGHAYLAEQREIVVLPAAGLLGRQTPRRTAGAVTLACSRGGQLPLTRVEGALVHQLLPGAFYEDAAARLSALPETPRQVLHIAAHGHYRMDQPDLSYIELAEGQVYADDLFQLDLSYELVTLSGCETGRAQVAPGDELVGLGRGFLYAGAGALVASLWPVSDESTVEVMRVFYKSLSAGTSKAAALRQAQCALLDADRQLHPAFWGAFQLIGDASPLSDRAP